MLTTLESCFELDGEMAWMENLFIDVLYTARGREVVCSLRPCHLFLFKWTVMFLFLCVYVQDCYTSSELLAGESCSSPGKQFSPLGRGLEMP